MSSNHKQTNSDEMNEISSKNFIKNIIDQDIASKKYNGEVVTRFPPEPNGYLHIGHAKSVCLNFGIADEYPNAKCFLRYDDTNPIKEEMEYVHAIEEDIKWLNPEWGQEIRHTSDYYDELFAMALELINKGKAYVCDLSPGETREYRGTLTEPGRNSPFRERSIEENLKLFTEMKEGLHEEGSRVLRAKIDMTSGNINMRDPAIYRIRKASHQRTGDKWCIYPMYDFAHCMSDYIEGTTHSICTLEFQDHRPLYDWFVDELKTTDRRPYQYEFARLNLNYTVTSKRKLKELVDLGKVSGWDDPRMPTIRGFRRRGYTPEAIRNFCKRIGVAKKETIIDLSMLEETLRDDLNERADRSMAVIDPIKVTITNYPEDKLEELLAPLHPQQAQRGTRPILFSKHIYIEREDFEEVPPPKYKRLSPGAEVRLRYSYVVRLDEIVKDPQGNAIELKCSYDPETLGKKSEGRKVPGIIHWISDKQAVKAQVNLYERLFMNSAPTATEKEGKSYLENLNPNSLETRENCLIDPALLKHKAGTAFQFERLGYFAIDPMSSHNKPILNMTTSLRNTWEQK